MHRAPAILAAVAASALAGCPGPSAPDPADGPTPTAPAPAGDPVAVAWTSEGTYACAMEIRSQPEGASEIVRETRATVDVALVAETPTVRQVRIAFDGEPAWHVEASDAELTVVTPTARVPLSSPGEVPAWRPTRSGAEVPAAVPGGIERIERLLSICAPAECATCEGAACVGCDAVPCTDGSRIAAWTFTTPDATRSVTVTCPPPTTGTR